MKFSTRQDIDAPVHAVFEKATDFPRFERVARRRGVALTRTADGNPEGEGTAWDAAFDYRGKARKVSVCMNQVTPCDYLSMVGKSAGVAYEFNIEFVALSPSKSRMVVGLELRPTTLPARLMIQSLKLGKSSLDRKFADGIRKFAEFVKDSGQ